MLLDGGPLGEILLPHRYVPEGFQPGDELDVFISNDSEDRLVATTETPFAMADEFALLEVVASTRVGSFLNWGMPKDLLLPFGEQPQRVRVGQKVLVHVHLDRVSGRLVASAKLKKYLAEFAPSHLHGGTAVSLIAAERTDLGVKCIVNGEFWGLLKGEGANGVSAGDRFDGFVARIREDGLVDVSRERPGYGRVPEAAEELAKTLAETEEGFLPLHDKSPPEKIREMLGISKKVFKQSVGALYKAGRVRIAEDGIHLLEPDA
jgi:predicted RNA-binding protein (virulence factor B family)